MSYSIRNYIKKNCTEQYSIEDLQTIAENISEDSNGRYTSSSALKIIVRYACVKNKKIIFDVDTREPDTTLESLTKKLQSVKSDEISNKTNDSSDKSDKSDKTDKKIIVKKTSLLSEPKIEPKTESIKPKKRGFGVFSMRDESNNLAKQTIKDNLQKSKFTKTENGYKPPSEQNYKGLFRTEKQYGPYGTDNYHTSDSEMTDDDIKDPSVKNRINVFRDLNGRYYPPQRSPDWFKMRDEMITASDGGTIVNLNPYEHDFGFISKKVFGKPFETSEDCYHGKKFEQVATMVYEYRMNVKVKEFGLCRHPTYDFLGASPDGIVSEYKLKTKDGRSWEELEKIVDSIKDIKDKQEYLDQYTYKTKYVGRMLEIKCPMRRKILMDESAPEVYGAHDEPIKDLKKDVKKGICPAYYWVQVQLQLQCCELDECDFWQCEIFEYADREDFLDDTDPDTPWLSRITRHEKGALIQLMPYEHINNKTMSYNDRIYNFAEFIYQPRVDMTPAEIDIWILKTLQNLKKTHRGYVFESVRYWKTVNTRNTTILRDDQWFEKNLETFRSAWKSVEYFRKNKDKAKILQKYINTFPLDYYKKVKEPIKQKGIIMKTIKSMTTEPDESKSSKEHKQYAKLIADIEKTIENAGIEDPKPYDVSEDVQYVKDVLTMQMPDDIDEEEKKQHIAKFTAFIKNLKQQCENYLMGDDLLD